VVGANAPTKIKILLIIGLFSSCKHPLISKLSTHGHLEEVVVHPHHFSSSFATGSGQGALVRHAAGLDHLGELGGTEATIDTCLGSSSGSRRGDVMTHTPGVARLKKGRMS
jgi:hypothetical protein